jgi:predicted RecB family nuclease
MHQQRIVTRVRERFAIAHAGQIVSTSPLDVLRPSDLPHLSSPVYATNQSFGSEMWNLTLDAIKILPPPSGTTKLPCIPIKASPTTAVSKNERLELCMIALILQKHAPHLHCTHCTIISEWNGAGTTFSIDTHIREARRYLRQLTAMNDKPTQPRYYRNDACKTCPNKDHCLHELTSKDDLSLLGSMSSAEIDRLNARGILTVNQLSYTWRSRKTRSAPARPNCALKALALREKRTYILEPPVFPDSPTEVFVDFEGFPDERCVYLIGMIVRNNHTEFEKSFWAECLADTDKIMTQFLTELQRIRPYVILHYGSFETRALRRFAKRTENALTAEINSLLGKSINVLAMLSQNVYPPTYTNDLKEVAGFLGFKWSTPGLSGLESIILRQKWEFDHLETDKEVLVRYNLDDCAAVKTTKDWLADVAKRATEGCEELRRASDVKSTSFHRWGKPRFEAEELDAINKCSYFDYQRSKVYLRTSKAVRIALRRERKSKAAVNAVDREIGLPERCPCCGGARIRPASKRLRRRRILDLRFMKNGVKKWVVEVDGKHFRCIGCDKVFEFPMYGRNLVVWSMNQHVSYRIGMNRVGQMLLENFNIDVPEYKLSYLKSDLVKEHRETATQILQGMVRGPLIQIDETSAFLRDAPSAYVWVFASMDSVFYMFRPNREAGFLHELLKGFNGVLVSDFYSGYDSLPCKQQRCLVHLIRDLNADLRKNQFNVEFKSIVARFGELLRSIVVTIDKYGLRRRHLEKHQKDVATFFRLIGEEQYETEIAAHYQRRLTRQWDRLFQFLGHDGVPWNNNNAENAIKPFAKYREMAKNLGTQKGLEDYLVLLSIQQTCKYRGISFLEFLKSGKKSVV